MSRHHHSTAIIAVDDLETRFRDDAVRDIAPIRDLADILPEGAEKRHAMLHKKNRDRHMQHFQITGDLSSLLELNDQEEERYTQEIHLHRRKQSYYKKELHRLLKNPSQADPDQDNYVDSVIRKLEHHVVSLVWWEKEYGEWKELFQLAREACSQARRRL